MIVRIDVVVVEEEISHTCIYIYDSADRRGSCRGGNFTYMYIYIYDSADRRGSCRGGNFIYMYIYI